MKYQVRKMYGIIIMLFVVLFCPIQARAAEQEVIGVIIGYDDNHEPVTAGGAVAMNMGEGEIGIFSEDIVASDSASFYSFEGATGSYEVTYFGNLSELECAFFAMETDAVDTKFLEIASAYQGEEVTLCYLGMDEDDKVMQYTLPMVITGCEEKTEGIYSFDYSISAEDLDTFGKTVSYPLAAVMDEFGRLVAVVMPSGDVVSFYADLSLFPGDEGESQGESTSPSIKGRDDGTESTEETTSEEEEEPAEEITSEEEESTEETTSEKEEEPTEETASKEDEEPGSKSGMILLGIVGGILVLAGGAVGTVIVLSRKKKQSGMGRNINSIGEKTDDSVTMPIYPVNPTSPVIPEPKPASVSLYLCCEGGRMNGRRYQITEEVLLIGRDPSCNICYPADTKGVSRRHCQIFWKNGVLMIMDLGSTNGTFIRGKGQIQANVPTAVNAGDTFYLGEKNNAFVIRME